MAIVLSHLALGNAIKHTMSSSFIINTLQTLNMALKTINKKCLLSIFCAPFGAHLNAAFVTA